ncbi:hypothetical protein GGR17_002772 [Confluentimicrobium naphthalenivorans]|uniref:Uncharacterized protein n=1 Tax=Actibacterium naphthalenivorans TaxID=1614693 RepID=A0A840CDM5_9RHOB|nr:hypothetical protein [Actibacterium naphthalenivorans]
MALWRVSGRTPEAMSRVTFDHDFGTEVYGNVDMSLALE